MKKIIVILVMVTTGSLCFGQQDSVYTGNSDSVKAKDVPVHTSSLKEEIETGRIYRSTSPHHNVLHEFTYLVATRDYCSKTLSQIRDSGKSDSYRIDKKLSKKLKKELSKAKEELASSKYNGLKTESSYYELFLKQINDKFRD